MVMLTASVTLSYSSKKVVIMKYSLAFETGPLSENVMGQRLRITHKSARWVIKFLWQDWWKEFCLKYVYSFVSCTFFFNGLIYKARLRAIIFGAVDISGSKLHGYTVHQQYWTLFLLPTDAHNVKKRRVIKTF